MERNEKGQFIKGQYKGGPGRPPKATEQEYLDAIFEVVPLLRFKKMIEKQAARAEKGDIRAFEVIAKYVAPYVEHKDITSGGEKIEFVVRYADDPKRDSLTETA